MSIINKFKIFIKSKYIFKKPPQRPVMIYDDIGYEIINDLFDLKDVYLLDTRKISINIYILINSLISNFFNWSNQKYIYEYIKTVNPNIVITTTDNDTNFWKLKKKFKKIKFYFIQNGSRDNHKDVFSKNLAKEKSFFSLDAMFVFNKNIGKLYSELIEGEVIPIGSYNNNRVFDEIDEGDYLLYISQFDSYSSNAYPEGHYYFLKNNYSEKYLFKAITKIVKEKNIKIKVLGRKSDNKSKLKEKNFFKSINSKCEYIERDVKSRIPGYKVVNKAKIIISTDSTLAYEALSKEKKVALISTRGFFLGVNAFKFGWPKKYDDNGEFWTNEANEDKINEIINFLLNISHEDWKKLLKQYKDDLMIYDPKNTIIKNYFKNIQK